MPGDVSRTALIRFDSSGNFAVQGQLDAALRSLPGVTDLLLVSHGFLQVNGEAETAYQTLVGNMRELQPNVQNLKNRQIAVWGLLWPSRPITLNIGGSADLGIPIDKVVEHLINKINDLKVKGFFSASGADDKLEQAKDAAARDLQTSEAARRDFVGAVRGLVQESAVGATAPREFFALTPTDLLHRVGALGEGIEHGAEDLLNLVTFREVKALSGAIGQKAAENLLGPIHEKLPDVRLHLAGHSLGAELVAAAAAEPNGAAKVSSMTLVQGAFTRYGFAYHWDGTFDGPYRPAIGPHGRITGPTMVTYTRNDEVLLLAYQAALRLSSDVHDDYVAIGTTGAQKTKLEVRQGTLLEAAAKYDLDPAILVYNLCADKFIHSHMEWTGREVANAILNAIAAP
jgi:hypothetical protein